MAPCLTRAPERFVSISRELRLALGEGHTASPVAVFFFQSRASTSAPTRM